MVALTLHFVLPLMLLIQHTGATCVYSWLDSSGSSLGPCDAVTCVGSCVVDNGCSCANGIDPCLPKLSISCNDFDPLLCCPSGLYYSSAESCCTETPICTPDCATDEVCDKGKCVCNPNLYQDKTLADLRPTESYDKNTMSVTVGQCLLSSLGYDLTSITLSDPSNSCTILIPNIINGQKVITLQAQVTPGWCGNTVVEDGPRSYVTNSITIHAKSNSSAAINPINFTISCPLYTGTDPNTQMVMISGVSGLRLYPLTMSAYKDSEFRSPYVSTEIVLGSKIYVALYVYYKDGDAYVLRLQDCAASPTPERNNTKAFHLISEGCAADNLTRIIQNGNSTEVRMEISYSRFRNFDTIYLFCDARLCKKSGEECNMCKVSQAFSMNVTELQLNLMVRVFARYG